MIPDLLRKPGNLSNPKFCRGYFCYGRAGFAEVQEEDVGSILLNKVAVCDLNWSVFIRTFSQRGSKDPLEFRVELNDFTPLIQKPSIVGRVLGEIMKRLIQRYVHAGFYIRRTSHYVSPKKKG
jgi:hypothetical protein